jgi:hypothetical protein
MICDECKRIHVGVRPCSFVEAHKVVREKYIDIRIKCPCKKCLVRAICNSHKGCEEIAKQIEEVKMVFYDGVLNVKDEDLLIGPLLR